MTYSQRSTRLLASSDITHLEIQIQAAKEERKQAELAGNQTQVDEANLKVEDLESELANFEE
ncbi:hypothetical protein [Paenibacillus wynnii]|uniref:Uncharacterized protein n=1 Tax=Paenibacillus wynnii TaxID=268407 RepID=A0A098M9C1_9BACL|nr:hypothetical protein [Paenibacillus wynnii]KGE19144.1 hypothetical protein PWYN_07120 [Paenibacillus wynnii]